MLMSSLTGCLTAPRDLYERINTTAHREVSMSQESLQQKGPNALIGLRLRELRIDRHLQQVDVAKQLGVSAAYLNLIEKGKRAVQLPLLWKALAIYGVEIEPFMRSLGESKAD